MSVSKVSVQERGWLSFETPRIEEEDASFS